MPFILFQKKILSTLSYSSLPVYQNLKKKSCLPVYLSLPVSSFSGDDYSFLTLIWIDRAVQIRLLKYIYCDWIVRHFLSYCKFILPAYLIQMYSSLPVYLIHLYLPLYKILEKILPPRLLESSHPYPFIIFW